MKRGLVGLFVSGLLVSVWACNSDSTTESKSNVTAGDGGAAATSSSEAGLAGVDCSHPGAGKSLGNNRCECTTTHNVAGDWSAKRTCREGDACPTRDKDEQLTITQDGTTVSATRSDGYALKGTLCGDILVWTGGPKDGLNPECGELRFTDDGHYVTDSCYVASGQCAPTHSDGCPTEKGQCTGTGAKSPDAAPSIQKLICSQ
jgi:hypothetical protein